MLGESISFLFLSFFFFFFFFFDLLSCSSVQTGTCYVDITGEPLFVERVYQAHHQEAVKTGISIVTCCGFDCVPSDISISEIRKQVPDVTKIDGFLRSNAHG